jgi:hypothetical protein
VGDGAVWATTIASRAERIEAASARATTEFYAGSPVNPVALGGGAVWVGGADGQLWKVDRVTGSALLSARAVVNSAGIAVGNGSAWVTSFQEPVLVRVDEQTGDVEATIPLGGPAEDVLFHEGLVWVPVGSGG